MHWGLEQKGQGRLSTWLYKLECVEGSSDLRVLVCPSLLGSQACVHNCTLGVYLYLGEFGVRIFGKGYP